MTGHEHCKMATRLQWLKKPENQFNVEGGYALFASEVKGSGCIRYKWYNPSEEPMPRKRSPILEIDVITKASFGTYRLEVTNCLGEHISAEANLHQEKRVIESPYKPVNRDGPYQNIPKISFIRQPMDIAVPPGFPAELSVSVEATAPKFQWFYYMGDNNLPIHGQNKHKLAIGEVREFNYATFYVEVTDIFGQRLSSIPARLHQLFLGQNA